MKQFRYLFTVCAVVSLFTVRGYCDGVTPALTWSGLVSMEGGQVVKGEPDFVYPTANTDHIWMQKIYTGFNMQLLFNPLPVTGNLGMEMKMCNEYPEYPSDWGKSRRLYYYPYLSRADLNYSFGNSEDPDLNIGLGFFPFKYNSDAKNLGEYLFRSGTYPQYLITEFDFPMARLCGLHINGKMTDVFKWDILATVNTEWTAIGDVNLTGIASYKPFQFFEIGAGASWCSIISANWDNTTPMVSGNDYIYEGKRYYYTFAGQKIMGRFTLDPQSFFPNDIFGPQDFKLYTEAAILGVINYPVSVDGLIRYDDIKKRVPVMVGFNAPVCKILDVLSLQAEWFGSRYPNDLSPIIFDNQPIPLSSSHDTRSNYNPNDYKNDDWKWSLYGKRTFADHFQVTFQFARDHMRWFRMDFTKQDGQEALRENKDWYYIVKLGYVF